jgi:hypothetical protein
VMVPRIQVTSSHSPISHRLCHRHPHSQDHTIAGFFETPPVRYSVFNLAACLHALEQQMYGHTPCL